MVRDLCSFPNLKASTEYQTSHGSISSHTYQLAVIDLDARDPHLAASLRKLGPVQPFPTFSPSSTSSPDAFGTDANTPLSSSSQIPHSPNGNPIFPSPATNPALAILTARSRIAEAAEQEKVDFGKPGFEGRRFLDVATVRKALVLRDEQGMEVPEIERALGLARGVVGSLGRQGIVEVA